MSKVVKTIVSTSKAYKPHGPYSQAVLANNTLYVSGVLGANAEGKVIAGGTKEQARKALENLQNVLEAGGASLRSVLKTTVLLIDMNDFADVNKIYAEFFDQDHPARACYQVAKLPAGAAIEIEAIALSGELVVDSISK